MSFLENLIQEIEARKKAEEAAQAMEDHAKAALETESLPEEQAPSGPVTVALGNVIEMEADALPFKVREEIMKRLTFDNPRYFHEARFERIKPGTTRYLTYAWNQDGKLILARGFMHELIRIFHANRVQFEIQDRTVRPQSFCLKFKGSLNPDQTEALETIRKRRFGIVTGPRGSGKKVLALKLAAARNVDALVIVKSKARMYQWKEAVCRFLNIHGSQVGMLGDGRQDFGEGIAIAIDRTLYRHVDNLKSRVGMVIGDQCERANLKIFTDAVIPMESAYLLGLGRSDKRLDGLDGPMKACLGPLLCELKEPRKAGGEGTGNLILVVRPTDFQFDFRDNYGELTTALIQDQTRNDLIVTDILECVANPRARTLLVCDRIEHAQTLKDLLEARFAKAAIVKGRTPRSQIESVQRKYGQGNLQVIITTQKSIHKLETNRTNHLFVASPIKYGDHLFQAMGALMKAAPKNDQLVIHDYRDSLRVLMNSLKQRVTYYRSMGLAHEKTLEKDEK
ncbi:DNA or RNA helicase of superfamily II-like protein [Desulfatibacillum aliphaticivorans]|uniref:DNA or RNA helicase of superfamily II-like protein n=1 Tax=Desulfatibacillum aliphaticivorans TaxID=218208 RepID=B8FGC2_DESAL|nr:DEAD/DEAH box helicase family protein [Desulfatibacillum aliphaticivorans]ACL03802.1 DNA or RNA helicase of superfamily II-like protein [Desulfatibacillum aliphaticivorans]